jgi:D-serine deaminase-like pyridoxal phosphate-dependent protein
VNLGAVERNIAEMARRMADLPAALRLHAKIQKSPIRAQMQLDAWAIGLTTATVWEAAAFIDAWIANALIANQVQADCEGRESVR